MRQILCCIASLSILASTACTSKPSAAFSENAIRIGLEKHGSLKVQRVTLKKTERAVFHVDCTKNDCYAISYEATVDHLRDNPVWKRKGGTSGTIAGELQLIRTSDGWEILDLNAEGGHVL